MATSILASALLLDLVALVGGTVHTMEPGSEPRVATVVLDGDRISAVGENLELAPGTVRIDVTGKHLVPGLIDGMINFDPSHDALYLAHGVTTVRDVGGDLDQLMGLRDRSARDLGPGPWLVTAGVVLDGYPPASPAAVSIRNAEDVPWLIGELAKSDVDFLSVQPGVTAEAYEQIVEQAAVHGLEIWGQRPRGVPLERAFEAKQAGFFGSEAFLPDGVQWDFVLPIAFKSSIAAAVEAGTALVPVLAGVERLLQVPPDRVEDFRYLSLQYEALWRSEWELRKSLLTDEYRATSARIDAKRKFLTLELSRAGGELLPGSAAPLAWAFPGRSLIDELDAWVAAGLSHEAVLTAATSSAARLIGLGGERGVLSTGRIADLVVLDADPRESFDGFRNPATVVVRGVVLSREVLADMVEDIGQRQDRAREANLRPLELAMPPLPEGDLILGGQVSSRVLGTRISSERFAVVRRLDGSLSMCGRMFMPRSAQYDESTIDIEQVLDTNGDLVEFRARSVVGERELVVAGRWDAGRFLFRRYLDGQTLDTTSTVNRSVAMSLDPLMGSVTTALVIGQHADNSVEWTSLLAAMFEPVSIRWEFQSPVERTRMIRTSEGGVMQIEYGENGAPTGWVRAFGGQQSVTVLETSDSFGGPGLPVRFKPAPVGTAPAEGGPANAVPGPADESSASPSDQAPPLPPAGGSSGGDG